MSVATVRNLQPKQGMESNAKQKCMASDINALNVCSSFRILIWQNGRFVKAHRF